MENGGLRDPERQPGSIAARADTPHAVAWVPDAAGPAREFAATSRTGGGLRARPHRPGDIARRRREGQRSARLRVGRKHRS